MMRRTTLAVLVGLLLGYAVGRAENAEAQYGLLNDPCVKGTCEAELLEAIEDLQEEVTSVESSLRSEISYAQSSLTSSIMLSATNPGSS